MRGGLPPVLPKAHATRILLPVEPRVPWFNPAPGRNRGAFLCRRPREEARERIEYEARQDLLLRGGLPPVLPKAHATRILLPVEPRIPWFNPAPGRNRGAFLCRRPREEARERIEYEARQDLLLRGGLPPVLPKAHATRILLPVEPRIPWFNPAPGRNRGAFLCRRPREEARERIEYEARQDLLLRGHLPPVMPKAHATRILLPVEPRIPWFNPAPGRNRGAFLCRRPREEARERIEYEARQDLLLRGGLPPVLPKAHATRILPPV